MQLVITPHQLHTQDVHQLFIAYTWVARVYFSSTRIWRGDWSVRTAIFVSSQKIPNDSVTSQLFGTRRAYIDDIPGDDYL